MFRPWRSFPTMVAAGLLVGIATGGFPGFGREMSQIALIVAMTFSLTEISFSRLSARSELRGLLLPFAMSYGILSSVLLVFAALSTDPAIRAGWVITAAVPPAVAVVPITSLLRGNTRRALFSLAFQYLVGLGLVPGLIFYAVGQAVPVFDLASQTLVLIGLPILLSRGLQRWRRVSDVRPTAVALSFLVLVTAIAGSTRDILFSRTDVVTSLVALSTIRTFGVGFVVFSATVMGGASRDTQVAATAFASFKNLGLAVVLAFSFFDAAAALPSIVSLVLEILWLGALPFLFGRARPGRGLEEKGGQG